MSKRTEQALKAYPILMLPFFLGSADSYDTNEEIRIVYEEGYEQAEKDLALTWGDIQIIDHFILELAREEREGKDWGDSEKFYTEVLNRFNKSKEK